MWNIPLQMNLTKNEIALDFILEIPLKFIRSQKISSLKLCLKNTLLRRWSWELFLNKVGVAMWFWKSLVQLPNLSKFSNLQEICRDIFVIYRGIHGCNVYILKWKLKFTLPTRPSVHPHNKTFWSKKRNSGWRPRLKVWALDPEGRL